MKSSFDDKREESKADFLSRRDTRDDQLIFSLNVPKLIKTHIKEEYFV